MPRDISITVHMDEQMSDALDVVQVLDGHASKNGLIVSILRKSLYGEVPRLNMVGHPIKVTTQSDAK